MTAAPNFAYALFAKRLRRQAKPGEFDLSSLRWALSGAEQVEPADVEDLFDAASRSDCGRRRSCRPTAWPRPRLRCRSPNAAPAWWSTRSTPTCWPRCTARSRPASGKTTRLATLGPLLAGLEARVVDEVGNLLPTRGVGVIELRGEPVTRGYITTAGFIADPGRAGWYDTGDLGYLTEQGHVVVCGRVKDVIIMAGRSIYPTDIERAAGRRRRGPPRLRGRGAARCRRLQGIIRRRCGVQRLRGHRRGAAHQARGRPRGGRRGRHASAQHRGARAPA